MWIGVDTGGTFTDLVLVDPRSGRRRYLKVATSGEDASRAILEGVAEILEEAGAAPAAVAYLGHGTTLGTNALLERRLPPTGMITTAGFRDVLDIARQRRPHMFDLRVPKPDPIVPREARMEVAERLAETGAVVVPLDEAAADAAVAALRARGCEAVAICFLHAYANPAHETRVRDRLVRAWPGAYACASSEVLGEMREYERFATTVVNAALMPVLDRYLERLEQGLGRAGVAAAPRIMQSSGGSVAAGPARRLPVSTILSGPAAGVTAAVRLGRRAGIASPALGP